MSDFMEDNHDELNNHCILSKDHEINDLEKHLCH